MGLECFPLVGVALDFEEGVFYLFGAVLGQEPFGCVEDCCGGCF